MPIILITGANGHGKGQFAIREILRLQDENDKLEKQGKPRRQIYANIHGINQDGVTPLRDVLPIPSDYIFFGKQDNPDDPPPDGYFVPPLGSIFFYDECQKVDWIKQKAGALSNDIRVRSMEEHRHAGLDIYLITQSPNYIHSHLFDLASPHYYVERALNLPQANVFKYTKAQKSPQSTAIKAKADDQFFISLGKKYGQYYQSSQEHNMKTQIPNKVKFGVAVLFILVAWTVHSWNKAGWKIGQDAPSEQASEVQTPTPATPKETNKTDVIDDEKKSELDILKSQHELKNYQRRIYLYETTLPKDYEVIKSDDNLQVRGLIKMGNKCNAYNTHGDLMTLSLEQCNYYLKNGVFKQSTNANSMIEN